MISFGKFLSSSKKSANLCKIDQMFDYSKIYAL
jgi:hypothetical protein